MDYAGSYNIEVDVFNSLVSLKIKSKGMRCEKKNASGAAAPYSGFP